MRSYMLILEFTKNTHEVAILKLQNVRIPLGFHWKYALITAELSSDQQYLSKLPQKNRSSTDYHCIIMITTDFPKLTKFSNEY